MLSGEWGMNDVKRKIVGLQQIRKYCLTCKKVRYCSRFLLDYEKNPSKFQVKLQDSVLCFFLNNVDIGSFSIRDHKLLENGRVS